MQGSIPERQLALLCLQLHELILIKSQHVFLSIYAYVLSGYKFLPLCKVSSDYIDEYLHLYHPIISSYLQTEDFFH